MGLTWQWVSILCPTGPGCLFCASWYTGFLICASTGRGCLFRAQQGGGIYCVPHRTGVSIGCLLGHRVSNMSLTWQWVCFLCTTGQGCLFCASWGTVSLICASHGSGCLICAQQGSDIYCVIHRIGVSFLWFEGHMVSNMCLTREWVFILGSTGQGYLLCASQDRDVNSGPLGHRISNMGLRCQ